MSRIGVIDIGSNLVRMTVAEVESSGYFRIIDELKENVRLGEDLFNCSLISEDKINLTLSVIKAFKTMCSSSGADKIFIVISEVVRLAENKSNFKSMILNELGLDAKILTNDEELYYNFLGAKNSVYTENSLMVDINSNTVHLAWIINNKIYKKCTLPFGYLSLTSLYNLSDVICHENNERCLKHIKEFLCEIDWLINGKFNSIVGIGGTFRNLGKIDRRNKRYPLDISHNYILFNHDINNILFALKSKNLKQRQKIEGLSSTRADVIVAATEILNEILNISNTEKIKVCGSGLREGILYEYLEKHYTNTNNILDSSLKGILETLHVDEFHAYNVCNLAMKIFNGLYPLHNLGDEYINILKTSALLHDCGNSISYYDHHLHSFYIILNSHINGLEHKERLISAFCAAFHRNNSYEVPLAKFSSILNRLDINYIEKIGIILKIAEGLDRSLTGSVEDLEIVIEDNVVTILLKSTQDLELEIRQALRCKVKFEEIYRKDLVIRKF